MLTGVNDVLVNLIGEDVEVVVLADHLGDGTEFVGAEHGTGGVLGGVDDDKAGILVDVGFKVVEVGVVGFFFGEAHGDGLGTAEADHGLEDGEAGVGVDDLVAGLGQGEDGEEHDGLGAGHDDDGVGGEFDAADGAGVAGDGIAEFGQAGSGAIVGVALMEGFGPGVDDILRGIEVGFADLHVYDVLALGFQGTGLGEHFKGGLGAEVIHAAGKSH